MKSQLPLLLYALLTLVCILPMATLWLTSTYREMAQALTCVLSTEIVGPALILGLASLVYFVRNARTA